MDPALFRADMARAPEALMRLADEPAADDPWAGVDLTGVERVLMLGMGSSAYAAGTVALSMRAAGLTAVSELASAQASWPPDASTLVVAVSATGGSVETLQAAQRYAGRGRLVALVENTSSALAATADAVVPLLAGTEDGGVACRSYRHTLVRLLALRDRLVGASSLTSKDAVRRGSEATTDLLGRQTDWLPAVLNDLDGADGIAVIAPAERLGSARQSALMVREGPRRPATASETGDWAHVDVYLARTLDYRVLLLAGSRWDAAAMEWLTLRGSRVVPVGAEVTGAAPAVRYRFDDDPMVRLLTEVTVAELVAAHWWAATRSDPAAPGGEPGVARGAGPSSGTPSDGDHEQ